MNKLFRFFVTIQFTFFLCYQLYAQEKLEKSFNESFSVENGDLLDIENEYGKIVIKEIDGNELKISVNVIAEDKDTESTQQSLDRVTIEIKKEGKVITAHTILDAKANAFKSLVKSVGDAFSNNLDITYEVEIPKGLDLDIYQKNGDIRISEISAKSTIELNDGELKLEKITSPLKLTIKGAEGTIASMNDGTLLLENSTLEVKQGGNIILNSNVAGSKLNAGNIESLFLDSKNDEISCLDLGGLSGKSTLSKIKIEKLYGITDFNLSFGFISVEEITADMESISVESKSSGDIFLDFAEGLTFDFELIGKKDNVTIPENNGELIQTALDDKGREARWKGKVGSGDSENKTVTLKAKSGGKVELNW